MNCPECRKKLWYWAALSRNQTPNQFLTYLCQNCNELFVFATVEGERAMPKLLETWRGYRVYRRELNKRGYQAPPLTQRTGTKAAPSPDRVKPAQGLRRGD